MLVPDRSNLPPFSLRVPNTLMESLPGVSLLAIVTVFNKGMVTISPSMGTLFRSQVEALSQLPLFCAVISAANELAVDSKARIRRLRFFILRIFGLIENLND